MSQKAYPRDRFDDLPIDATRIGAHRAEQPGMSRRKILLWSALASVALIAAGILVGLQVTDRLFPTTVPEEAEPTLDPSYAVLILNASGEKDLEDVYAERVQKAGWTADDIDPTVANSADFGTTTVYYASDDDEGPALGLADALGVKRTEKSDAFGTGSPDEKQLVIVLGKDATGT